MEKITMNDINKEVYDEELKRLQKEYEKVEKKLQKIKAARDGKEKIEMLEKQLKDISKKEVRGFASKRKTYVRYCKKIISRLGKLVYFLNMENRKPKQIELSTSQASIYYVLLMEINEGTITKYWIQYGQGDKNGLNSFGIVALYERLQELIKQDANRRNAKMEEIDEWLLKLKKEIDYQNAKKVVDIYQLFEKLDLEGQGINHQINYGSVICIEDRIQQYATISFGQYPSAMPKCVNPQDYVNFVTLEQFYSGLEEFTKSCYKNLQDKSI